MSRTNYVNDEDNGNRRRHQSRQLCIRTSDMYLRRKFSSFSIWSQNAFRARLEAMCENLTESQLKKGTDAIIDGVIVDYDNICAVVTFHVFLENIGQFESYVADIIHINTY